MLHRTLRAALAAALPALFALACGTERGIQAPAPAAPSADTRQAALWLVGDWSSAEQAATDPSFRDIVIHIRPIWTDRTDGMWMYVEQAMASAADRPYRQRVYQMVTAPDGTTESRIFELPGDPLVHAGAWKRPQPLDDLEPELLQPRAGCTVHLSREKSGSFTGATRSGECATDYQGATYTMSDVTLSAEELVTWDRGYDAAGTQVWGSTSGPYIFRRSTAATTAVSPSAGSPTSAPTPPADPVDAALRSVSSKLPKEFRMEQVKFGPAGLSSESPAFPEVLDGLRLAQPESDKLVTAVSGDQCNWDELPRRERAVFMRYVALRLLLLDAARLFVAGDPHASTERLLACLSITRCFARGGKDELAAGDEAFLVTADYLEVMATGAAGQRLNAEQCARCAQALDSLDGTLLLDPNSSTESPQRKRPRLGEVQTRLNVCRALLTACSAKS